MNTASVYSKEPGWANHWTMEAGVAFDDGAIHHGTMGVLRVIMHGRADLIREACPGAARGFEVTTTGVSECVLYVCKLRRRTTEYHVDGIGAEGRPVICHLLSSIPAQYPHTIKKIQVVLEFGLFSRSFA